MPIQPSPRADTSKPLRPSLRFSIAAPSYSRFAGEYNPLTPVNEHDLDTRLRWLCDGSAHTAVSSCAECCGDVKHLPWQNFPPALRSPGTASSPRSVQEAWVKCTGRRTPSSAGP